MEEANTPTTPSSNMEGSSGAGNVDIRALNDKIQKESSFVELLTMEMDKVIIGQKHMTERLLIGLLSNGHILLEGVPGLAKTLAINTLADRKSTRLNSSHVKISYAVFCLKKKKYLHSRSSAARRSTPAH